MVRAGQVEGANQLPYRHHGTCTQDGAPIITGPPTRTGVPFLLLAHTVMATSGSVRESSIVEMSWTTRFLSKLICESFTHVF